MGTTINATDLASLQESAVRYQKDLQYLPYAVLMERLGTMGINLFPGVQNKDVLTTFLRNRGVLKPYSTSSDIEKGFLGKAIESTLTVEKGYANIVDNIQNYKKTFVGPDQLLGKNQSKQHPWEMVMLTSIVRTVAEDLLDSLFPGERDIADTTPLGCFDGIDTLIAALVSSTEIAEAKGNLVPTGSLAKPSTESDFVAYTELLNFYRAAHQSLKNAQSLLLVPTAVADAYSDAYFNRYRSKPTSDDLNRMVLDGSSDRCKIVRCPEMGTGDRIILTTPGNIDFGMDSLSDSSFVSVRNPYEDPNLVQFWLQGDYGLRIRVWHSKMFQINDGTPVANALSGDYVS